MRYKLSTSALILRVDNGDNIPMDPANTDYAAYLKWIEAGNTPEPADPEPAPSAASQIEALEASSGMPRVVRDFMLGSIEAEAAKRGLTYAQLRAANPGYRKVKELDERIIALRAQL